MNEPLKSKVIKLVTLTTSPVDGEALSALRALQRLAQADGAPFLAFLEKSLHPITPTPMTNPHLSGAEASAQNLAAELIREDDRLPFLAPFDRAFVQRIAAGETIARGHQARALVKLSSQVLRGRHA